MDTDQGYIRAVSLHLARVLDKAGLNELTVRRRRHLYLFQEQLYTVSFRLKKKVPLSCYHFGSQTEGATTRGLDSDVDTLSCFHEFNVIENWTEWQQGQDSLLMLQDRTPPGYCRLQLLRKDKPVAREEVPNDIFTRDSDGRVIAKNKWLNTPEGQEVRNGPATTLSGGHGFQDKDDVSALHCNTWPTQAEEFIRRQRRHGWPSQNLLQEAVTHGVFLVPVGYKLSTTEHLEWRISASLTERCLMFSLNTVHIKCYVVLKMLVKSFIEPHAKKCISSHHCKTAILYSVENTSPAFWRDDNLLQCVIQCLTLLITWVTDEMCPHFIIAEENLFAGKVTAQNRNLLQSILKDLITRSVPALLDVHIDDLGHKLQDKFCTEPSAVPVLDSWTTINLITEFEFDRQKSIRSKMDIIVKSKNTQLVPVIRSVYRKIVTCKSRIRHSVKHERQAIEVIIEILYHWLGSLLTSLSLSNGMRDLRLTMQLLRIGVRYDVASLLKFMSAFYNNGYFPTVESQLYQVEIHMSRCISKCIMQPVCFCYHKIKPASIPPEFFHNTYLLRGYKRRNRLFAHCVSFFPQEINCTPHALRNEFFRSIGDDLQHRDHEQDIWMDMAVVDCFPFLYYLQHMTYRQLGKHDLQRQSLHNLDRYLREEHNFGHLETGWNLLGQCKELEQEPEAAMTCYMTSLEIRPRNNAANWHVAMLCYKEINKRI